MHTSKSRHILLQAVAAVALCASAAHAADYVWNSPNAGNWSDLSENGWNAASYPAAAADTAMFSQDITGNRTITINVADASVGELTLTDTDPSHNWTIARTGSNRLTLDNGASEAVITSTTGSNTISAPITLASHLRLVVTGTSLTFNGGSDAISGAYNITIDGTSTGNVSLSNNTSIANNINNIIINGGTLTINAGSSNGQNNITVNSGGRLRVTGGYGGLNDSSYVTLSGTGILDYSGYSGTDWMAGVQSTSTTSQWIMGTSGTIISNSRTFNGVISGGGPGANLQLNSYTLGGVNTY